MVRDTPAWPPSPSKATTRHGREHPLPTPSQTPAPPATRTATISTNLQEFAFGMDPTTPTLGPLSYVAGGDVTKPGTPVVENFAPPGQAVDYRAVFARRKDHAIRRIDLHGPVQRGHGRMDSQRDHAHAPDRRKQRGCPGGGERPVPRLRAPARRRFRRAEVLPRRHRYSSVTSRAHRTKRRITPALSGRQSPAYFLTNFTRFTDRSPSSFTATIFTMVLLALSLETTI